MPEERAVSESRVTVVSGDHSPKPRKPFVSPAVQDLGGLTTLTLLGGSL